ncbi:histidine kinase [Aureivirga sp. CE67]|uniref:histidine kinase n=1 Tax=Aureivirga sp. CE67 TaxID=1788983 RepID=UPI0018CA62A6|nr:histidine kinase [Aureivirga sp. CE67]
MNDQNAEIIILSILIFIVFFILILVIISIYLKRKNRKIKKRLFEVTKTNNSLEKEKTDLIEEKNSLDKRLKFLNDENKELEERKKNLQFELNRLKLTNLRSTVDSHSFKNTLSTVDYFADKTMIAVKSISKLFDYMLYDSNDEYVLLEKELDFANQYVNLYKLRLDINYDITSTIEELLDSEYNENLKIAPLILANFIENIFKHGDLSSEDAKIQIETKILNDNEFVFVAINTIKSESNKEKGGVGKNNFEERLKLLYPDKYELHNKIEKNCYIAELKLELHE